MYVKVRPSGQRPFFLSLTTVSLFAIASPLFCLLFVISSLVVALVLTSAIVWAWWSVASDPPSRCLGRSQVFAFRSACRLLPLDRLSVLACTTDSARFAAFQNVVFPARSIAFLYVARKCKRVVSPHLGHTFMPSPIAPWTPASAAGFAISSAGLHPCALTSCSRPALGFDIDFLGQLGPGTHFPCHILPFTVPSLAWHLSELHCLLDHFPVVL